MEMNDLIIMKTLALAVQVCTTLSDEEATTKVNAVHPAGTEHGWMVDTEQGCFECDDNPGRRHIVFVC